MYTPKQKQYNIQFWCNKYSA